MGTPVIHLKDDSGKEYLSSDSSVCKYVQDSTYAFTVPDATKEFTAWQEPVDGYTVNCTEQNPGKVTNTSLLEIVNTPDSGAEMENLSIDVKKFNEKSCTRKVKVYQDGTLLKEESVTNHADVSVPKYDSNGYRHWYFIVSDDYDSITETRYLTQDIDNGKFSVIFSPNVTKSGQVTWKDEDKSFFNVRGGLPGQDTDKSYSLVFTPQTIDKDDGKGYVTYKTLDNVASHTAVIKQQKDIENYSINLPVYSPTGEKIIWSAIVTPSPQEVHGFDDLHDFSSESFFIQKGGRPEEGDDITMIQEKVPVLVINATDDFQDITLDGDSYYARGGDTMLYALPLGSSCELKAKDTSLKVENSISNQEAFHFSDGMSGKKYAYRLSKECPVDFNCLDSDLSTEDEKVFLKGVDVNILNDESHTPITQFSSDGDTKTISLAPGNYTYMVMDIPDPYEGDANSQANRSYRFEVGSSGNIQVYYQSAHEWKGVAEIDLYFHRLKCSTMFSKEDAGGNPVTGAKLTLTGTLYNSDKKVSQSWVSSANSKSINLAVGSYTLHEDKAPDGYALADDIHFTVEENGVYINGKKSDYNGITMIDKKKESKVLFNKADESGHPVSGSKLEVKKDGTSTAVADWTSGNTSHEEDLEPGTYTLHESSVPSGYGMSDDIKFTVTDDGKVTVNGKEVSEVTMTDKKIPVLPNTGSRAALIFTIIGIAGAITVLIARKHDDNSDDNPPAK